MQILYLLLFLIIDVLLCLDLNIINTFRFKRIILIFAEIDR